MRIALDVIPEAGRPTEVVAALDEAHALREQLRAAQEALAAKQQTLDELERADVEAAAARVRAGEALGTEASNVKKARSAVEGARRDAAAIALASEAAQSDLAAAMSEHADTWLKTLGVETAQARERALAALAELDQALATLGAITSAAAWVESAQSDERWDRPVRPMLGGSVAPSSRRVTANGEALTRQQVLDYVRELVVVEKPTQPTQPLKAA
jgi:hypothetical protein